MIVAGIHGNEQIPVKYLKSRGIPFILGNPRAIKLNKRFIDNDLNSSFNTVGFGYEYKRAAKLLTKIDSPVLDLHTFSCKSKPFAVITSLDYLDMAKTMGVRHVVYMNMNIKGGHSLIDQVGGVSVEVGHHKAEESVEQLEKTIECFMKGIVTKVKVYEVYQKIYQKRKYVNFRKYSDFYPVLAGEKAYKFVGLKARLM